MATHVHPRLLTENEKREVLKCSMVNLGRLLAESMELHFYREPGAAADAPVRLDIRWPDATVTTAQFAGCSPVYRVPMVAAVDAVLDELEV